MSAVVLFQVRNIVGTFVFGPSGAMVAVRRRLDIFGVLVLAVATGVAGGMLRDMALGAVPPEVLRSLWPLAVASLAGLRVWFFKPLIQRLDRPVMLLDAVGLGVFSVAGCRKALILGLDPPGAVLLGVMTAIGGGMLRDMMVAEVPRVLREEVYALAAFAGGASYCPCLSLGGLRDPDGRGIGASGLGPADRQRPLRLAIAAPAPGLSPYPAISTSNFQSPPSSP